MKQKALLIYFGKNIKKLRHSENLTQSVLAEKIGVEPKHISCIENGISAPSFELIEKLAKAFNKHSYELFLFEEKPSIADILKKINEIIHNASNEELEQIYLYSTFITTKHTCK